MTDLMPRAAGEEPHAVPDDHLAHVADSTPVVHKAGERKHLVRNILTWILRIVLALVFGLPLLFMIVSSFKPDLQIFADLTSIRAFLPVGDLSLDNYAGISERVPFVRFLINSVIITVCTVAFGLIVNSMAAFALSRIQFRGQKIILGVILATLDRAVRDHGAAAAVVGEQAAVLRLRQRLHPGLAGLLPGADRAVHRQRLLDLPLLPVLRLHPEVAGRGGNRRRGGVVQDLLERDHAAIGTSHRDGGNPRPSSQPGTSTSGR